ncbi:hypothetical protein BDF14DRAFT_1808585 [Spinellus fusiger]|nr:hypothetical protein BDF14DRAFT_1808585 [Spinellus fusiger]
MARTHPPTPEVETQNDLPRKRPQHPPPVSTRVTRSKSSAQIPPPIPTPTHTPVNTLTEKNTEKSTEKSTSGKETVKTHTMTMTHSLAKTLPVIKKKEKRPKPKSVEPKQTKTTPQSAAKVTPQEQQPPPPAHHASPTKPPHTPKRPIPKPSSSQLNDLFCFSSPVQSVKVYRKLKTPSFLTLPKEGARTPQQKQEQLEKTKQQEEGRKRMMDRQSIIENFDTKEVDGIVGSTACPYCREPLEPPLTMAVEKALQDMKDKDEKYRALQLEKNPQRRVLVSELRRDVPSIEQFSFCRLHSLELKVKPQGIQKGYPVDINFEELPVRIQALREELVGVVDGQTHSIYRDHALKAYEHLGTRKARSTMAVMNRFEKTLPGYYGSKGAVLLQNTLNTMFIDSGYLTKEKSVPQMPLEYLQQVLVPEAAYRLIRDDLAKKGDTEQDPHIVMNESSEFGSLVHVEDEYL